jgi:hypothetical protein
MIVGIYQVKQCMQCPNVSFLDMEHLGCGETDRDCPDDGIPQWCPLEKREVADE